MADRLKILHSAAADEPARRLAEALAPVRSRPVTVLFATPELDQDPQRNTLTQLALAAHAEHSLVVVATEGAVAPLGLRDIAKHSWSGALGEKDDIVKAIREAARASQRKRGAGWIVWPLAALVALLILFVMFSANQFIMAPEPGLRADRSEVLRDLIERGQLSPEQALQVPGLLEQDAPLLRTLRGAGFEPTGATYSGALRNGETATHDVAAPAGAKIAIQCLDQCVGLSAQLSDQGSPIQTAAGEADALLLDVPSGASQQLQLTVACASCVYAALVYAPIAGASLPAPDPMVTIAARLDTIEESTRTLEQRFALAEGQARDTFAQVEALRPWLLAIAGGLAVQFVMMWVLLLRRPSGHARPGRGEAGPSNEAAQKGPLVFASYSRQDRARVDGIVREIQRGGVDLWLDREDIGGGTKWPEEIVRAIRSARGVILFCSPHAFESDHVLREISLAAAYGKPLLPIQLEPAPPPDGFLYYLSTRQIIDLSADPSWREKLLAALKTTT